MRDGKHCEVSVTTKIENLPLVARGRTRNKCRESERICGKTDDLALTDVAKKPAVDSDSKVEDRHAFEKMA